MARDHQWARHAPLRRGAGGRSSRSCTPSCWPRAQRAPVTSAPRERRKGPWWGWGDNKAALEHLFYVGRLGAMRRANFERAYCDPTLVVPAGGAGRARPRPSATRWSACWSTPRGPTAWARPRTSATTSACPIKVVRPLLEEMADEGVVERVEVEGWKQPAYVHPDAHLPRWVRACALVSPFDSVMWERDRVERVFGFTLPHRDLRPEAQAGLRLLRAAVPARGPLRGPGRPQGGPGGLARCWCSRPSPRTGVDHLEVAEPLPRRAPPDGRLAGAGRRRRQGPRRPGPDPADGRHLTLRSGS